MSPVVESIIQVDVPVKVQVPEPMVIVLVVIVPLVPKFELLVKLKLLALKVPLFTSNELLMLKSSCKVSVVPGTLTNIRYGIVFPALVKVAASLPLNSRFAEPPTVMSEINVIDPKTVLGLVPMPHVGLPVAPTQLILLPRRAISTVTVCEAEKAALITTSSCGSGTLVVQALADQLPPEVPDQVWVAAVVNVMPEFPPASPEFPVIADKSQLAAPAPVISWKSALDTLTVAAVIVIAVPRALGVINVLPVVELLPFMVSTLKVLEASTVTVVPDELPVKVTLLYVNPAPVKTLEIPVKVMVDVPALKVRPVAPKVHVWTLTLNYEMQF